MLTWHDQGLARHDENNLHGPKVGDPQLLPCVDRIAQLGHEDGAEIAHANHNDDVVRALQPDKPIGTLICHHGLAILHHPDETEGHGQEDDDD